MDVIYSKPNCPGCEALKAKYKAQGKEYREVVIGKDIPLDRFLDLFPTVKSVPFVYLAE